VLKIAAVVQYRDHLYMFMENGAVWRITVNHLHDSTQMTEQCMDDVPRAVMELR